MAQSIGFLAAEDRAARACSRGACAAWVAAIAAATAFTAWLATDVLHLPREGFVLLHTATAAALAVTYARFAGADFRAAFRDHAVRGVVVVVLLSPLVVRSVLSQAGAPRAEGAALAWQLAVDGLLYGAVDGFVLTVLPMLAARAAFGPAGAFVASALVFAVYHLGFAEFRNATLLYPMLSAVLMAVAYLLSRSALAPVLLHVLMHVVAVLHGPAGTLQLPPHAL